MYLCHLLASALSAATLKLLTVCLTCHLHIQAWQIRETISPRQALTVQICSPTAYASWHATWFPPQNQLFSDTRIWIGSSKDRLTSAFREMQILSVFSDRIFNHFSELILTFSPSCMYPVCNEIDLLPCWPKWTLKYATMCVCHAYKRPINLKQCLIPLILDEHIMHFLYDSFHLLDTMYRTGRIL